MAGTDAWIVKSGAFLLVALTIGVSHRFNAEQPAPYMDELFHVPQVQHYCAGNYTEVRSVHRLIITVY